MKVKLPGSNRFRELAEGEQLPVGTVVDTLKGRVTLVAAGGQTANFYDGIFKIGQGKGAKPLTTLTLVEKLTCPKAGRRSRRPRRRSGGCGATGAASSGRRASTARRPWSARVAGRGQLQVDPDPGCQRPCLVRDFAKKKTVIVRAGKKYVAGEP